MQLISSVAYVKLLYGSSCCKICDNSYIYFICNVLLMTVNDTMDDIFDEDGDEEEQDAIVNQVLDEIGIEISGKVSEAIYFFPSYLYL